MEDESKNKKQLIQELAALRQKMEKTEGQYQRLSGQLSKAKELAEAIQRWMGMCLGNISQEIRIPLGSILAANHLLLETKLEAEQREFAEKIQASAESLLTRIDDFLDFSKIETGELVLETIDFDLRTTVEDATEMLTHQARAKGLELACLIHHDVPSLLSGDPGRLRQILMNLTQNALKFTEKGEILIQVTLEEESETHATLHFGVMDTGKGIAQDRIQDLVASAPPADDFPKPKLGMPGLGLPIAKKIVEMMGGKLGVESEEGYGSTFWFTAELAKQKMDRQRLPIEAENIRGQRVLVVDPRASTREGLKEQLQAWGCLPEEAQNGQEALGKLHQAAEAQNPFPLAILTQETGGMDGAQWGRRIKEDPQLQATILILLASKGNRGDARRMQEIGFSAHLTKPLKSSLLYECLILLLGQKSRAGDAAPLPLITRYSLAEAKKRRIRILLAEEDPHTQRVGIRVLEKIGYRADVVVNGKEVLSTLARTPYDLILMDVQMPEMDGFQTTAAIRQKEKEGGRHIPIVGMTARALEGDRERCLQVGMDDYIPKPIWAVDIVDVIDRFFPGGG